MSEDVNTKKIDKVYTQLVEIFQKSKLNVKELLITYANLGYALGASIGGYKDKGPGLEQLEKLYYEKPTIDVALMLQSLTVGTWAEDLDKKVQEIKNEKTNK